MHENFSNAIENWEIGELKKQDIRNLTNEEELFASARDTIGRKKVSAKQHYPSAVTLRNRF